nr:hypothetical protein [uncultured Caldimonas sp.]
MKAARTIQRLGFRKWYERELIQSHMHLVLLLMSAIGLLASAEVYSSRQALADQLLTLVCAIVSAVIGVWALRRYLYLLLHAEEVASQAVCPQCHVYARWTLIDEHEQGQRLHVRCRACEHEWDIAL